MNNAINVINAIKVSLQVAQEASQGSKNTKHIPHTELLNRVAKRLGVKDFRALNAMCAANDETHAKAPVSAIASFGEIKPFTIVQYSCSEFINSIRYEVEPKHIERWLDLSKAARNLKTMISFDDWQDSDLAGRTHLAVRPAFTEDGELCLEAEAYDKYATDVLTCYGRLNLELLLNLVQDDSEPRFAPVCFDYIWNSKSRELFILSDVNDPQDWIDFEDKDMEELLTQYNAL